MLFFYHWLMIRYSIFFYFESISFDTNHAFDKKKTQPKIMMFCWLYLFFVTGEMSALYNTILTTSWLGGSGDYIFVTRSVHYFNETVLVFNKLKKIPSLSGNPSMHICLQYIYVGFLFCSTCVVCWLFFLGAPSKKW